jgi:pimeloyl-ACP methyl ester carboxylesterase
VRPEREAQQDVWPVVQYRELIPRLADHYRVIAPDLPGFGFTESIARPGNVDIQLDLFRDYQSNVQLYPPFSHIFARSGLRFWPFGARVTHPSCRQGPRPICATIRTRKSSCYFLRAHRI